MTTRTPLALAAATLVLAAGLSACSAVDGSAAASPTVAVLVAPGAADDFAAEVDTVVDYAAGHSGHLTVASTAADASRSAYSGSLSAEGANQLQRDADLEDKLARVEAGIAGLPTDGVAADPVGALLDLQAGLAQLDHGPVDVVVLGPTLPTTAPFDLTTTSTVDDPAASATALISMTGLDCTGWRVYLVGTTPGQSAEQQQKIQAAWSTLISSCGGAVVVFAPEITEFPVGTPQVEAIPATSPVSLPVQAAVVFDDATLGFLPDSTELRDPAAARAALADHASYLASDPSAHLTITGTTSSHGSEAGRLALSQQRAEAVAALVVGLGGHPSQIETLGVGTAFAGFVDDRRPDGTLDPVMAAQNRNVIVVAR